MNSGTHIAKIRLDAALFITVALLMVISALANTVFSQAYSEWSAPENLGTVVNSGGFDGCPSLTKDGLSLLFMTNDGSTSQNLFVTHRESSDRESDWSVPTSLGNSINTLQFAEACPYLSISGRYLYFQSDRPGGCGNSDIYVARRRSKESWTDWAEPVNLGCEVNSAGPEFSPSISEDEDGSVYLYFSSGLRPGGLGFGDVWVSKLQNDGTFGPAEPVVALNSTANDIRPKVRARDGLEIFFDSNRPDTFGMQDLYTSTRACTGESADCAWSVPVNLGSVVNASSLDGGPSVSFAGTELFFMSNRTGGSGNQDIWVIRREKLTGTQK